jgi:hypothetical protein
MHEKPTGKLVQKETEFMAFLEDNNPKRYPHGHFTAHIALYVSFGSYMGAYDDAVTVLL